MKILALTKYDVRAASTRQRFVQYVPYLSAHGIEVEISPLLGDAYLRNLAQGVSTSRAGILPRYLGRARRLLRKDFDLLWVQYDVFPYLPSLFERLAGLGGKPIVCDFDDAIFHLYDQHKRALVRRFLGSKLAPLLSRAAACICGNAYLQAYAARWCPNSVVIPTVVDTERYLPAPRKADRQARPVVGWIGSPTTWANVEPLLPTILPLLAELNADFHVVGAGPAARGIAGVTAIEWAEDREIAAVQAMDIGIMPLLDRPFQRGKCGYKLIQYMACGLAVVASPIGVNRTIVEDGATGLLADGPGDWARALRRLIADPELRRRMGAEGRRRAVAHYSLASQQGILLETLRAAAEGRAARIPASAS
ncbi:MAG TPA: glycosyltransferase family 4 protein [Allosphingosinicella sp.]|nr:glycosyltransferase family 4 protein [Allosphingosinicella sp.]